MRILSVVIVLLAFSAFAQTTRPADPAEGAAALKSAREEATVRFLKTAAGKALAEKVRAAEAKREQARSSGTDQERATAATALLGARNEYNAALKIAIDADPAVGEAAAIGGSKASEAKDGSNGDAKRQDLAIPPLNRQILAFAEKQLGQQVGDGECWTLADQAFRQARVKHPGTYVWGRALAGSEQVLPGDVIQFKTVRLEKDGSWQVLGQPDHTAVVKEVHAPGLYVILHQNYGDAGRTVSEATVDMNTKTEGEFVIYRPGAR